MSDEIVVDIRDVSFCYGEARVLHDVTLQVPKGMFLGLIGPNGGGKSTLLKMIVGLARPHSGTLRVFGLDPMRMGRQRGRLGYVPQRPSIIENFPASVRDVVLMGASAACGLVGPIQDRYRQYAEDALALMDLQGIACKPIGNLSGGQQQRTFVARALVTNPEVLVLDEPVEGIDTGGQRRFFDHLVQIARVRDITIIMVAHEVGELMRAADSIACLAGHLHWHGTSDQLDAEVIRETYGCELSLYLEKRGG